MPSSWKNWSNTGVTLVEKLRIIVLFQGDFNYLNKYIVRHMMKDGEAYEQLAWEQYGSREEKNAIEQALNKVLSFDLIQQPEWMQLCVIMMLRTAMIG
jgi:hypothetical protein